MEIRMEKEKQIIIDHRFVGVVHKAFIFSLSVVFIIAVISSVLTKCELFTCECSGIHFVIL